MESLRLLHITDFHIDGPDSEKENLRNGYYQEFFDELIESINERFGTNQIDGIISTGDFVNRNKYANYGHVDKILNYLIDNLGITTDKVCLCPGNHDIDYFIDKTDGFKAREQYYKFADKYKFGEVILKKNRYIFSKISEEVFCLSIDNTLGSSGENMPGVISTPEIDEILNEVIKKVPQEKLLIIASHFPLFINSRARILAEEQSWVDNHYWRSGNPLVTRILSKRRSGQTIWLYGDAHLPDFFSISTRNHFFMTGMIGGNYLNRVSTTTRGRKKQVDAYEVKTEVKVIEFLNLNEEPTIHTFRYVSQSFKNLPSNGIWEHGSSPIRLEETVRQSNDSSKASAISNSQSVVANDISNKYIAIISTSVQKAIIDRVRDYGLYNIGRYVTSENKVTLGWVSLNKLFEDYQILTQCVEKSVLWLNELSPEIDSNNTLIVGLDFWGAIVATQLSVRMVVENVCISTRKHNENSVYNKSYEFSIKNLCSRKDIKNVIIITDVITTGNTVYKIYNLIKKELEICSVNVDKWIIVSLLADIKQARELKFDEFFATGTFCGEIRFPTINSDELPDESMWPVDLNTRS